MPHYITIKEKILIGVGTASALLCGFLLPSLSIIVGEVTNTFDPHNSEDEILKTMSTLSGYIALVGLGTWVLGYFYYAFWQHVAESISFDLRSRYLHNILKQEVAFFEKSNVEQLPT